ncbi:sodium:solute symporter [Saccharicrinis sp. FJH2]|uniref:sodium:solute symporter family protein n=1 Tax=Saccharicrinis sp. FJH65 TaxID=3344659 RepID=UPI0035F4DD2E
MEIHWIDALIFILYLAAMLGVGFYFLKRNSSDEDYYVGGRSMTARHVGLSVVATDVGGGFSIGLGGLGFTIGLSGSWMLFTGLLGAWLSAALLIPKIYPVARKYNLLSFPEALKHYYNKPVAVLAGVISLIGYIGFTSSQILAGAKLATATFPAITIIDAVLIMGIIAALYTVMGGIKAVIYTDTIQWIILISGLFLIGIPYGYYRLGGWQAIQNNIPDHLFSLTNITFMQFFNWLITIVPIWFVGMTLYQRIYACKDEKTAKRAWRIAGLFEWPVMAFMGVILGLFARIAFEQGLFSTFGYAPGNEPDPELGLPLFLVHILPVGLMGLMMSAYFSAIMSTADSCLMAASGNLQTDIIGAFSKKHTKNNIKRSQLITLVIGTIAILLATTMQNVLELMLYSYAFMVSGLFVPVLAILILKKPSASAASWSMINGGFTTLILIVCDLKLPLGLDANFFGIAISAIVFITVQQFNSDNGYATTSTISGSIEKK